MKYFKVILFAAALVPAAAHAFPSVHDLKRVNAEINSARVWGSPQPDDVRDDGPGIYDCENYAEDKGRRLAKEYGAVWWDDMKMVLVTLTGSQYDNLPLSVRRHTVLVVHTPAGKSVVLDNRFKEPMTPKLLEWYGYKTEN